jgi:hypothetical protein
MSSGRWGRTNPAAAQEASADEGRDRATAPMAAMIALSAQRRADRGIPARRLRGLGHARRRALRQQDSLPGARGTLMRHVLCAGPPAAGAHGVEEAAPSTFLVRGARPPQRGAPGLRGASAGAIDLAPIAPAADQYRRAAAPAEKPPRRVVLGRIGVQAWTLLTFRAIIFRHLPLRSVGRGAGSNCQVVVGAAPVLSIKRQRLQPATRLCQRSRKQTAPPPRRVFRYPTGTPRPLRYAARWERYATGAGPPCGLPEHHPDISRTPAPITGNHPSRRIRPVPGRRSQHRRNGATTPFITIVRISSRPTSCTLRTSPAA